MRSPKRRGSFKSYTKSFSGLIKIILLLGLVIGFVIGCVILYQKYVHVDVANASNGDLSIVKSGVNCGLDGICGNSDDSVVGNQSTTALPGSRVNYTLNWGLNGNNIASTNTIIQDTLPQGMCYQVGTLEQNYPNGFSIQYSNSGGSDWTYRPVGDLEGKDCFVTNFRLIPNVPIRDIPGRYSKEDSQSQLSSGLGAGVISNATGGGVLTLTDTYGQNIPPFLIPQAINPTYISDCTQLLGISLNLNAHYQLINNIDCSGQGVVGPIGSGSDPFKGVLDGGGFRIENLSISVNGGDDIGLFAKLSSGATVRNVTIRNSSFNGSSRVGSVAGSMDTMSYISNVTVDGGNGGVSGIDLVGGIVGFADNSTINLSNSSIFMESRGSSAGGIVGSMSASLVRYSNFIGELTCNGVVCQNFGGVAGFVDNSIITNSAGNGPVYGRNNTGGLIGQVGSNSFIVSSYSDFQNSTGEQVGISSNDATTIGGLIGLLGDGNTIVNTYAKNSVNGSNIIGGLVGQMGDSLIRHSYSASAVGNGLSNNVGGITGVMSGGSIQNSFAANADVSGNGLVGGIIGNFVSGNTNSIASSYFFDDILTPDTCAGGINLPCSIITSSVDYFYNISNAPLNTWDFGNIWQGNVIDFPTISVRQGINYGTYTTRVSSKGSGINWSDIGIRYRNFALSDPSSPNTEFSSLRLSVYNLRSDTNSCEQMESVFGGQQSWRLANTPNEQTLSIQSLVTAGLGDKDVCLRFSMSSLPTPNSTILGSAPSIDFWEMQALDPSSSRLPINFFAKIPTSTSLTSFLNQALINDSTITDINSSNNFSSHSFTIPPNNNPVANNDSYTLQEDAPTTTFDVLLNDTDADGNNTIDPSTLVIVQAPNFGGTVVSNGKILYTPQPNYNGFDTFTYRVRDIRSGISNNASVSININAVNDLPVITNFSKTTFQTITRGFSYQDFVSNYSDPVEGSPLSKVRITQLPGNGILTINSGLVALNQELAQTQLNNLKYTPNSGFTGTDQFRWTASDGTNYASNPATASIIVNPPSGTQNPIANPDEATVIEDDPGIQINVLSNDLDPEGDMITVCSVGQPAHGTTSINSNGTITYRPSENYHGSDQFSYSACNSTNRSSTALVNVTIEPVNDAPIARNDSITVTENTPANFDVLLNDLQLDPNEPALTICLGSLSTPQHGIAVINSNNTIRYSPNAFYFGTDQFTYDACDDTGLRGTAMVSVTVTNINQAPTAFDDEISTDEDTSVQIDVISNDTDPDLNALTICSDSVENPSHGELSVNIQTGVITYTPNPNYFGEDSFVYSACDELGLEDEGLVTITVVSVNDPPVANPDTTTTTRITTVDIDILGNDIERDSVLVPSSILIITQPEKGTISLNTENGYIRYTPNTSLFPNDGVDTFVYKVSDSVGEYSNEASVTINVNRENNKPVLLDQNIFVVRGVRGDFSPIRIADVDEGDSPYTYTLSNTIAALNCTESAPGQNGSIISCIPQEDITPGVYSFNVTPNDKRGLSGSPAVFTIEVSDTPQLAFVMFKDMQDGVYGIGDRLTVQLDIQNTRNAPLSNLIIDISTDQSIPILANSLTEGTIEGEKYSILSDISSITARAATYNISYLSNNRVRIIFSSLDSFEPVSFTFQVAPQSNQAATIGVTASISGSEQNQQITLGVQAGRLTNEEIIAIIERTGGFAVVGVIIGAIIVLFFLMRFRIKKLSIDLIQKIKNK